MQLDIIMFQVINLVTKKVEISAFPAFSHCE